ncbi:pro-sigmaK processing inhibitor BofA family protein [Salsuginibacillus kocurii]|uniref:pro-sigmaK processing inhibitor BofA family protein n=1 Tax=Salsuginibacillus kocurii TaxID=427078 RepID=UPI00035E0553|nr:pro-sigmaK processing inhibitor BofA family protein [Salsuginibacillus kocurii]
MDPVLGITLIGLVICLALMFGGGSGVRPLQWVGKSLVRLVTGALVLFFINLFGGLVDFYLPINIITSAVAGFLGIPGVLVLVLTNVFVLP